ncbi:MAG: hypothetical protein R6X02_24955 [Enhygromyxa sp.]
MLRKSPTARALTLATAWTLACVVDEPLGPPGKNMTGPVTTTASTTVGAETGTEAGTETGAPGDTPGCDPLADPEQECGPAMTCDLASLTCVPAPGTGPEGDPCNDPSECSPGLVCASGRCRRICEVELEQGCEVDQICSVASAPISGLCLTRCTLTLADCPSPGEACKRVTGSGGQVWAACVDNPGFGMSGDACSDDSDCAAGQLCTPAQLHTLPCADEAPSCCAPICDDLELPCFGLEPLCYALGIPKQESAGFCGAG